MNKEALQRVAPFAALCAALIIAGVVVVPDVRARWFAGPEPVQLIIAVADNTRETRPVEMVILAPGEELWEPVFTPDAPADVRYFGFFEPGEVHNVYVEILGEHGMATSFGFRMTEDMKPVDTRNRIEIDVRDHDVVVRGKPISAISNTFQR